jgi:hypothetical protein
LKSQSATSSWGGARRALPYAFTEQGVAMPSSVLRSSRAVQVNVEIMRAFVRLRRILAENAGLARRLDELEKKYDVQFKVVFDTIRQLMLPPEPKKRIGFITDDDKPGHTGSGSGFIAATGRPDGTADRRPLTANRCPSSVTATCKLVTANSRQRRAGSL